MFYKLNQTENICQGLITFVWNSLFGSKQPAQVFDLGFIIVEILTICSNQQLILLTG